VIANALAPEAIYRRDDVYAVLRAAGRYIVEDGSGGRAVYRLSHQRLVDHLRPRGDAADFDARMERAAAVAVSLVDHYLALLGAGTPAREHDYLRFYTWRHCSDGGAVGIAALRKLVAVDVGVFLPDLAMALSDLGNRFSEFGRRQEALPPVREAVSIYRDLARDNAAFLPDLSMALNNLGGCFSELGRSREALEPTQEAVSLCQDLARENPVFLSNLEIATNNLTRLEERSASPLSRVLTRLRNALTKLMGG
jgi:tetratricopeptide (TPR) repeat protein